MNLLAVSLVSLLLTGPKETVHFTGKDAVTTDQLFARLREVGLAEPARKLAQLLSPGVRWVAAPQVMQMAPTGSRLGGRPALPAGMAWPAWRGTNLALLAQINLRELQAAAPRAELPAQGLLQFFYDAHQTTAGFDPKDKGSWQVLYVPDEKQALPVTHWPKQLPEEGRMKAMALRFQPVQTLPANPTTALGEPELPEKQQTVFDEVVYQFLERNKPMHQLLGAPVPIQGDNMPLECQLVSHGLYCGDGTGYNDPRAEKLKDGAQDWILLAMIDTDERAGWMWGDGGCLYFWIRRDDLRQRRFENVWMVSQCY